MFHNSSTYDYHFIIKQLAKGFEVQFKCFGENTEKYISFSVRIKKELDNNKIITYKLKFIYSFRFISTSLSKLVSWKRFDETSLPDKECFYSELYLKDIIDKDCTHSQIYLKIFKITNLG